MLVDGLVKPVHDSRRFADFFTRSFAERTAAATSADLTFMLCYIITLWNISLGLTNGSVDEYR